MVPLLYSEVHMSKINLTESEMKQLLTLAQSRKARVANVRRNQLFLMFEECVLCAQVMSSLGYDSRFITYESGRFFNKRLSGFVHHSRRVFKQLKANLEERVISHALQCKPVNSPTNSSCRKLHAELDDMSGSAILPIWRKDDVASHLHEGYIVLNDPRFEVGAVDVIELYLISPTHLAGFCINKKTMIQSLDCKDYILFFSLGCAENHGFEYKRNGTLSLSAAVNRVRGEMLRGYVSEQLVVFRADVVASQSKDLEIRVSHDNSSHKTNPKINFLVMHTKVKICLILICSSWLRKAKNLFRKIQNDTISRGILNFINNLNNKLMGYIREHNKIQIRLNGSTRFIVANQVDIFQ